MTQGNPLPDDPTLVPLFGGDGDHLGHRGAPTRTASRVVEFTLTSDAAPEVRDLHRRTTSATSSPSSSTARSISAPSIQSPIPNGHGEITVGDRQRRPGRGEQPRHGPQVRLPAVPDPGGPGHHDQRHARRRFLTQSLLGGAIGILLVFLFMLLYYRLPGLLADGALVYYALVVYAIFRFIPVTLTLAGIAGFVLSVGMAVDANILIFERTKEELRAGKSLRLGDRGRLQPGLELDPRLERVEPDHGHRSCTAFGSPTIQGFALVLIIGILVSMFTAIVVTRTVLRWVVAGTGLPAGSPVRGPRGRVPGPVPPAGRPARGARACLTSSANGAGSSCSRRSLTIPGLIFILLTPITNGRGRPAVLDRLHRRHELGDPVRRTRT